MSLPFTSSSSHHHPRTRFVRASHAHSLGRHTKISRRGLSIQLESTSFNTAHDALLETLSRKESGVGTALRSLYDLGALVGILGLVGGVFLLFWSLLQTISPGAPSTGAGSDNQTAAFSSSASGVAIFDHSSPSQLRPIVPGFTVPFFHTPVILVALFVSQVVHELGHAIAAAADAIPLHSVGASLALIIPSAHVALSNSDNSSIRSRLRVTTAGAWHNLLAWLILLLLSKSPISDSSYWTLGGFGLYEDIGSLGVSVLASTNDSPLRGHIPPASVITRLDDTRLSSVVATPDTWDRYLTTPLSTKDSIQGWCVSRDWYKVQASSCCKTPVGNATTSEGQSGLCFVPPSAFAAPSKTSKADAHLAGGRCVDPIALFQTESEAAKIGEVVLSTSRCDTVCMSTSKNPNEDDEICIRPRKDLELLRITLLPPPWNPESSEEGEKLGGANAKTRTVVWNGPKEEIWEQLTVGRLRPKASWVPVYLPVWALLFFRYLNIITLSLFIFNLLPIPKLDGGILLGILLDIVGSTVSASSSSRQYEYSTELMEQGEENYSTTVAPSGGIGNFRRQVERGIGFGTIGLVALFCMEASASSSTTPLFSTPAPREEASGSTGASTAKPSTSTGPIIIRKDRLYVGNLHPTVDEYILLQLFGKYGKISKLDFLFHKAGPMKGKPRGYAFVEYSAKEDASKALVALHDKLVRGRKLVVTFAQQSSAPSQDSGSSSYSSYPALGGSHNDRPGGRKGTDTTRPTTLSLIKSQNRPSSTSDKIAALEAKLKQIQASSAAASGSQSEAGGGGTLSPEAATALGVLPPKPPKATSST